MICGILYSLASSSAGETASRLTGIAVTSGEVEGVWWKVGKWKLSCGQDSKP